MTHSKTIAQSENNNHSQQKNFQPVSNNNTCLKSSQAVEDSEKYPCFKKAIEDGASATPGSFYENPKNQQYIFERSSNLFGSEAEKDGIHVPLVIDTEFTSFGDVLNPETRTHLTTQIKSIRESATSRIYSNHPEILTTEVIGATPINFELHALQYIADEGYSVKNFKRCSWSEVQNLPPLTLTCYSHFALAELMMVCHGDFADSVMEKVHKGEITMQRRLIAASKINGQALDWCDFDWSVDVEGVTFKIRLRFIDTCALHGVASYDGLASATGIVLEDKHILDDLIDKETGEVLDKSQMLTIALQYPEEFRKYSLGDLKVYDILVANYSQIGTVRAGVGIVEETTPQPKLTIGGTVKDVFVGALREKMTNNLVDENGTALDEKARTTAIKSIVDKFIAPSTAQSLRIDSRNTKALLAKVEGGRCRNNQPALISKNALWCDIDISGCYGEGQRNQIYAVGNPIIMSYPINMAQNKYVSLKKWLKIMRFDKESCDLVPGAWFARVSAIKPLKYSQDFFGSWFLESGTGADILAKYVSRDMKCDTELFDIEDTHLDTDDGNLKIFQNEIHNAVLTHDGLQWILNVASERQKNELLDSLQVMASMHYPASKRIQESETSTQELIDFYEKWDGVNQVYFNVKTKVITLKTHQPHAWIGYNIGEILIDKLLENRGLAKFEFGKKSPLEQMYKLCINTLYGDMVSKFFAISNTCVGNNITARARALAWYMEKGFSGVQSITDGCGFDLNKVLFAGDRAINGEITQLQNIEAQIKKSHLRLSGLGGSVWTGDENGIYRDGVNVGKGADNKVINALAMEHLQGLFPNVDVLNAATDRIEIVDGVAVRTPRIGQFSFETKEVYKSIVAHGSANYAFTSFDGKKTIKTRGYEGKKQHTGLLDVDGKTSDRYQENNPMHDFLMQLEGNPNRIERQNVALKSGILKIGTYLQSPGKFDELGLKPGDNYTKSLLVSEFSINQFMFKSHKQYKMWSDKVRKLKDKTGQSLEVFFIDSEGFLNYQAMIEKVIEMIDGDVYDPIKELDGSRNLHREPNHPSKEVLEAYRSRKIKVAKPMSSRTQAKIIKVMRESDLPPQEVDKAIEIVKIEGDINMNELEKIMAISFLENVSPEMKKASFIRLGLEEKTANTYAGLDEETE